MSIFNKETFKMALATFMMVGEVALLLLLLFIWKWGASTIDQGVINLVYAVSLGYHSAFMLVIGYYFGSSESSAKKNETLDAAVQSLAAKATGQPPVQP